MTTVKLEYQKINFIKELINGEREEYNFSQVDIKEI